MSMMYVRNLVDLHLKYYTDQHDVDEDKVTITHQGGHWNAWNESAASGVMCRDAYDTSTSSWNIVAYKYNKNSTLITGVEFYMNCSNLWICQITEE